MTDRIAEGMPAAVSTLDVESLGQLSRAYEERRNDEVRAVSGEPMARRIEEADRLAGKVLHRLGGKAAEQAVVIGIATVSENEMAVLAEARRLQSPDARLY
jgi:hypothetical protein